MKNVAAFLDAKETMSLREIPMPQVGREDVLVRMEAVGVCGSDLHYYSHGRIGDFVVEYPFILGHEAAGTVLECGADVTHLRPGDRVALEPGIPCGHCDFCLEGRYNLCKEVRFFATPPYHGCLSRYVSHKGSFAFKLPDSMTAEEGALVEPMAIGINAVQTGRVRLGDTVVVFGAGCIGLVTLLAALAEGAVQVFVVDLLDNRLETARSLGGIPLQARGTDPVQTILERTNGRGADVVIDCAGTNRTIQQSVQVARACGRIVLVGLAADTIDGLPLAPLSVKELTITSIFRYRNLYPTTIRCIETGKVDIRRIVTNRYDFDDTPRAYKESYENAKSIVKSVILFP